MLRKSNKAVSERRPLYFGGTRVGATEQMHNVFYVREISASGAVIKDANPYASVDDALAVILQHMSRGGIVKGWIEDNDGHVVMLPETVSAKFAVPPKTPI